MEFPVKNGEILSPVGKKGGSPRDEQNLDFQMRA